MGQGESKLKGSFTFAYVLSNSATLVSQQIREEVEEDEEVDNVLRNPEIYGLSGYNSGKLQQSIGGGSSSFIDNSYYHHQDSRIGLPFHNDSAQIINDLSYIDTTYYSNDTSTTNTTVIRTTNNNTEHKELDGTQISFSDLLHASPDNTLQEVYLSCRSILRLSPNIAMLTMIRKLDLSNNHLTELPESIGYMKNLESLILTRNGLKALPGTIGHLSNLAELDLSFNEVQHLTPCISYLDKLKTLSLAFNRITSLPVEISGLVNLISLDLTRNPLQVLPAEVSQLPFLRRIRLDDCPFKHNIQYPLKHNAPSLVEICARIVKKSQIKIDDKTVPDHIINYIQSAKSCTFCNGPYYESFVLRGRLMEKTDMHIPLQYTLCSAHWSGADDRILSMFSTQPSTSTQIILRPFRPELPSYPKVSNEKSTPLLPSSRKVQSVSLQTESNVTFETSAFEDISTSNNQLFPAAATTSSSSLKLSTQTQINKATMFNSLASRLKKHW